MPRPGTSKSSPHSTEWAAYHLLGFEDENLGSSHGWWAATVATHCPKYPNSYFQNLANDWLQFGDISLVRSYLIPALNGVVSWSLHWQNLAMSPMYFLDYCDSVTRSLLSEVNNISFYLYTCVYRAPGKCLYVVARCLLMVLLNSSAWPCLSPA